MPLDPQAHAFLAAIAEQNPPAWEDLTPEEGRKAFTGLAEVFGTGPEVHRVEDRNLPGSIGVRIYRPAAEAALPAVMYFHGGGWVLGDLNTHDTLCRRLAAGSGSVVISVEYRRPPEHKFPGALNDCFEATRYVADHAGELGVDAKRVAVAGDSAGGNLAAAVALRARDEGGPAIHSQWLIYPVIDRQFDTGSYQSFAEGHALTRANMEWFWDQYLMGQADALDPYAAPGQAKSLAGLPPAHVITAEFDVLRDEGESYASRLKAAGVPVTLRRYDGMLHGFIHFTEPFDVGKQAIQDLAAAIKKSLHP
jgi:acetyl esterase